MATLKQDWPRTKKKDSNYKNHNWKQGHYYQPYRNNKGLQGNTMKTLSHIGQDNLHEMNRFLDLFHSLKLVLLWYQQRHHKNRKLYKTTVMNIVAKILNKVLRNWSQNHFLKMYPLFNQWKSISLIYHFKEWMGKKTHDYLSRCRKSIWQNLKPLHDKNTQQTRNRRELLQPNEGSLWKPHS